MTPRPPSVRRSVGSEDTPWGGAEPTGSVCISGDQPAAPGSWTGCGPHRAGTGVSTTAAGGLPRPWAFLESESPQLHVGLILAPQKLKFTVPGAVHSEGKLLVNGDMFEARAL